MLKIHPHIKKYSWCKKGSESLVSQLVYDTQKLDVISKIHEPFYTDEPYAELWMGTHPSGMAMIDENTSLKMIIDQHTLPDLPFLFKVLSIDKILSIQVHPNIEQAKELHDKFPHI